MKNNYLLLILVGLVAWSLLKPKPEEKNREPAQQTQAPVAAPASVSTVSAPAAPPVQNASIPTEEILKKKAVLIDTILASKNDNDPRLDTEFKNLSDDEKNLLQQKYAHHPKEKLNERGTLIFLLGRETNSYSDLAFIKQAVLEQPCTNFSNCQSLTEAPKDEHAGVDGVTLAYPQVVGLKSLENILKSPSKGPSLKSYAQEIVLEAAKSNNKVVSKVAQQILESSNLP